jgi:O-antigen/teichoic acid export membrane protein
MNRLINTLERWLKTDIRYLLKGGFWLVLGQGFASIAALVLSIAFANLLSKDVYGIYKYILSIIGTLSIASLSGIDVALVQAIARNYEGGFIKGLKKKIAWGFIGSIIGFGIGIYYFIQANNLLGYGIIIGCLFFPFMNAFRLYGSVLNGKKLFKAYSLYNVITQTGAASLLILTLFYTKNLLIILSVYFLANTLFNLLFLFFTWKKYPLNGNEDPETGPYAMHLSAMDIINTISGQLDKILVFQLLGAAELAIYTIAVAPTEQLKGLLKNVNFLALPKFATRTQEEIKAGLNNKLLYFGVFVICIVALYIIAAPFLFPILFPQYLESIPYSQIMALSVVTSILSTFMYTILGAQAKRRELYEYHIYNNILNIGLLVLGIYFYGIWGAIFARVINRAFLLGLSYRLVKRM